MLVLWICVHVNYSKKKDLVLDDFIYSCVTQCCIGLVRLVSCDSASIRGNSDYNDFTDDVWMTFFMSGMISYEK